MTNGNRSGQFLCKKMEFQKSIPSKHLSRTHHLPYFINKNRPRQLSSRQTVTKIRWVLKRINNYVFLLSASKSFIVSGRPEFILLVRSENKSTTAWKTNWYEWRLQWVLSGNSITLNLLLFGNIRSIFVITDSAISCSLGKYWFWQR